MLKRAVLFVCVVLAFVGCSKDEFDDGTSYESITQTTLSYFMGTSLKSNYNSNITAMKKAVASGALGSHGAMLYLYPESSSVSVLYRIFQIGDECETIELCRYEEFSAYDEGALSMVLDDVKSIVNYTSDKTLNVIFSSHGYGWRLSSTATKAEEMERAVDVEGNYLTRFLGSSSDGMLDIADLCEELEGERFGYILFDACLMSSIEVLYRLRGYSDYVVASPAEVMAEGFPYTTVLPELFESDGQSFDLEGVCQAFYDFYESYSLPYGAVAVCVTSELEALAESVKALELNTLSSSELRKIQSYDANSYRLFLDLGSLVKAAYVSGDYDAFEAQLGRAFPEEYLYHTSRVLSSSSTVSITDYSGVSTSQMSTNSYAQGWSYEPWAVAIGANN